MVRSLFSLRSACTAYVGTAADYEGYGQPQGEEADAQKSLPCSYKCVPALGQAGIGICSCWVAVNLLAGRCQSLGLGRKAGTGYEQVVAVL